MRELSKEKKQNKVMHYMLTPIRILSKARDFYMKGMEDCVGRVGHGGVVVGCSTLPRSFSVNSLEATINDERLRELLRTVSKSNVNNKVGTDVQRQVVPIVRKRQRQPSMALGYNGMGRSYSVGLGKIGRIDEDKPCEFEEDEINMKADMLSIPKSRSYAVKRNVVVHAPL
ncbi:3-isopropylmalate dehydratase large subunit like [Quillaja saponaria]|uniref:3-isopropylmalate dehydratase large subunit like n=1 Tax=Quillaja saponaria TaxID=32244 RepID=A0AAD7M0B4_QUISA|nr:3-isopropylmalate dehydratase large subunit like [Quillaja saponaria]